VSKKEDCCANCQHFDNSPATLERQFPGLKVMGSAYSSVKKEDGLCRHHQRYLSATATCDLFEHRHSID
jgi:hypothetical protein